ncbi:MAG: pseudouridine synthase [bacterium]|nr:pseudouridine synthase [bacterium]
MDPTPVRLHVFLARAGLASRRECEGLIASGRIRVNGEVVTRPGVKVVTGRDRVEVDGQPVTARPPSLRYLIMNKPRGYLTAVRDPRGRPTVLDIVKGVDERVYPVGRLDRNTEGLLLLTNDGELAHRLTHPRFQVGKTYRARVTGVPGLETLERLRRGVDLEDGPARADSIAIMASDEGRAWVELEVHEGRHHLVRRMLEAVGHPVLQLRRSRFGPLSLGGLGRGEHRELGPAEVRALRELVGLGETTAARRGQGGEKSTGDRRHAGGLHGPRRHALLRRRGQGHSPSRQGGTGRGPGEG